MKNFLIVYHKWFGSRTGEWFSSVKEFNSLEEAEIFSAGTCHRWELGGLDHVDCHVYEIAKDENSYPIKLTWKERFSGIKEKKYT